MPALLFSGFYIRRRRPGPPQYVDVTAMGHLPAILAGCALLLLAPLLTCLTAALLAR